MLKKINSVKASSVLQLWSNKIIRKLIVILCLFGAQISWGDDYKSASKFSAGDVISAQVLNDIIDRMELALKTTVSSDLVGTWDLVQTTCAGAGGLGNCTSISGTTGFDAAVDSLYKQRSDTVVFSDDGDGTYSLAQNSYCAFVRSGTGNSSCSLSYAVVDGRFIFNSSGYTAYSLQRISNTRFLLAINASGSGSFNIIRIDKQSLPPEAVSNLELTVSSSSISQAWTASTGATSYDVHRKATALGTFASIGTPSTVSYVDSAVSSGGTYWYRVFAKNSDGTSIGSSVVKTTFNPANSAPVISSASAFTAVEDQTAIGSITASDIDSDSLTYTISGTEILISSTGVLSFNAAPVYATKASYTATVSVSDGVETVTQDITVGITEA